ncbi:MAG: hypothetical protein ACP5C3_10015 [Methanomicrobiales archaeon]
MKDENTENFSNSIDLKDEKGNILGAVGVVPSKELGKRDLILMDEKTGTQSARSITELINMLSKKKVSFKEKRRVLDFLAEKLRMLEQDLSAKYHSKKDKK